ARPAGPAHHLRVVAAKPPACRDSGQARLHVGRPSAAHERRRSGAPAGAAGQRLDAALPRAGARRGRRTASGRTLARHHDRRRALWRDRGAARSPAAHQRLARYRAHRRQEPRGAPRAGPSRPAGGAPDPRRLRAVPSRRTGARRGRRDPAAGARQSAGPQGAAKGRMGEAATASAATQAPAPLMLRIVGGRHRGRTIATPEGMGTRPTSNRAREALFNILAHASWREDGTSPLIDARVLDAFAGSGALGIEALSRGAAHATFLDTDPTAIRLIGENLRKIGEAANAKVIRGDATR